MQFSHPTLFACFFFLAHTTLALGAGSAPSHEATRSEYEEGIEFNRLFRSNLLHDAKPDYQPVHDTADFGYVLMSGSDGGSSEVKDLRRLIASNLPDNVTLVILTTSSLAASIRSTYEQWIPRDRLIVASDNDPSNSNGYWARDSFPIPVWNPQLENTSLVSMKYFRTFRSGRTVGNAVSARMISFPNTFVGGNLLADEDGNCFVINSERLFGLNASDLQRILGCKTATLMPHVAGIGDVDEVLKPIPGKRMLTTQVSYKARLESMGYEVIMLPSLSEYKFRTYANTLVVGSTAFMPAFGLSTDRDAAKVYESLGYRVVPIRTNRLSDNEHGSIHCQTMAYPPMPLQMLLDALGVSKN